MSEQFKIGDLVRVKDPAGFLNPFGKKVTDRDAVVEWVGPDKHGQFENMVWVRFMKRGNRGKEFRERMNVRELIASPNAATTTGD